MITVPARLIAAPIVLACAVAANALHQPSGSASAYSAGSAIYAAQVLTPAVPAPAKLSHRRVTQARSPLTLPDLTGRLAAFDVRGKPSISDTLIDQVLRDYGSPMAGQGKALYNLGVKYGIDPAYALAFFVHESAAGTRGEAVLTHSLGNLRPVAGAPSLDGYRYYDTWLEGAEDWYRLISTLYVSEWNLTTVEQIIPVYAPSGDNNDPRAYIDDVEQLVSAWRAQSNVKRTQPTGQASAAGGV